MAHDKRTQATMCDTVLKEDKLGWKDSLGAFGTIHLGEYEDLCKDSDGDRVEDEFQKNLTGSIY